MLSRKKQLSAAIAVALAASPALAVPTFNWTGLSYTNEGATSAANFDAPAITVTMGAEYAKDDLIALSFSSDLLSTFTPTSTLTAFKPCNNSSTSLITGTATENYGTMTLGLISNTAASATYRITATNDTLTNASDATDVGDATSCDALQAAPATTIGAVVGLGTITFDGPKVVAAKTLTGTYSATLSNGVTALDGGSVAITDTQGNAALTDDFPELIAFVDQYAADTSATSTSAAFNGIIDVAATPTRSAMTATTDVLTIDVDEASATASTTTAAAITVTSAAIADTEVLTSVVTGDWSYLVDENTATVAIDNDAVAAECNSIAATTAINAAKTAVTVTCAAGDVGDVVLTFTTADNTVTPLPALTKGAFTQATTLTYVDSGADLNNAAGTDVAGTKTLYASGTSAGAFTLNGSTSTIQAYPVGSGLEQFVWVTNTATTDGDISMTATQGGTTSAECTLGTAGAKTLTSVSTAINTCLTTAGITSGRAQVALTVNATATLVNVYAAYKVTSADDRLALVVSDGITD
jgi:hypothetical protein